MNKTTPNQQAQRLRSWPKKPGLICLPSAGRNRRPAGANWRQDKITIYRHARRKRVFLEAPMRFCRSTQPQYEQLQSFSLFDDVARFNNPGLSFSKRLWSVEQNGPSFVPSPRSGRGSVRCSIRYGPIC